jgi:bifunctional aspartokinase / homoserine dehydrogenase 1
MLLTLPFSYIDTIWNSSIELTLLFLYFFNYCLKVLRYVGVVDVVNQKGLVELKRYKNDHPFAQLSGSDNIIAFTTTRYKDQPLIVRGPGAGAEVTAGGVFSDILRLASYLGAPS